MQPTHLVVATFCSGINKGESASLVIQWLMSEIPIPTDLTRSQSTLVLLTGRSATSSVPWWTTMATTGTTVTRQCCWSRRGGGTRGDNRQHLHQASTSPCCPQMGYSNDGEFMALCLFCVIKSWTRRSWGLGPNSRWLVFIYFWLGSYFILGPN